MLIKAVATGRKWGDKRDPALSTVTIDGVKCEIEQSDSWEGGDGSTATQQQFWRMTWIKKPKVSYP